MCLREYCFFWPSEVRTVAYASYTDQSYVSAAFHQIQSKPGVTNCTEKVLEDIKILWEREKSFLTTKANTGVLSCFCQCLCMCCSNVVQWLHKAVIPSNFSKSYCLYGHRMQETVSLSNDSYHSTKQEGTGPPQRLPEPQLILRYKRNQKKW